MTSQYGFYVNTDECLGCRTCVIACKDKNDLPVGEKFRRVYDYSGGEWSVDKNGVMKPKGLFAYAVTSACHHCASPACFAACPQGAIEKRDDGIVVIDKEKCIGCGACAKACPFDAPYVSKSMGCSRKCDFCVDLLEEGDAPVCVKSCPVRCLEFGELEDLKAAHPDAIALIAPLPADAETGPSTIYSPHRMNLDGSLPGEVRNEPEEIISESLEQE